MSAEYGWTEEYSLSRTFSQIQLKTQAMQRRKVKDARLTADLQRVATQSDRHQYERFFRQLEDKSSVLRKPDQVPTVPGGVSHRVE